MKALSAISIGVNEFLKSDMALVDVRSPIRPDVSPDHSLVHTIREHSGQFA